MSIGIKLKNEEWLMFLSASLEGQCLENYLIKYLIIKTHEHFFILPSRIILCDNFVYVFKNY